MTFCERTTILLDCHPDTQSPCVPELEDSLVPPCPLWSCFVEATLEYCRVVFDLFDTDSNRRPVSVHIAGVPLERSILNTWQDQNLKQIADNFTGISPASVSPSPARLSHALESSLKALNQSESDEKFNARFVLILMGKGDEQQFGYQETRSHKLIDIRDVIRGILAQHEDLFKVKFRHLKRCHFDILRVLPSYEPISEDIPWTKIHVENLSTEFSATVYNILPGRKYLTRSMLHLVQLHHNLHTLRLLEVPMKKSDNTKTTYEIELLYQANNHKPGNISVTTEHSSRPRLFEPSYFKDRQTVVKWVKQKLYSLEGTVTRCSHMVTPIDISVPTRVLITSLSKGAIYALTDPSLSNNQSTPRNENSPPIKPLFSHILIFREGALYVHCQHINHGKNAHLLDVINFEAPPQLVISPKSDISMYSQFFEPFIIKPNLVLANRRPISKTIKVSGYEVESTQNLDIETRWLKTALSSNNDIILKLQSNLSEGGNLVHGILTELKNLLCVETPPDDYTKIANNILDRLFALGRGSDSFPNQKNAVALLKLIPEISEAFQSTSTEHAEVIIYYT
ncbi:21567_t:CDS:10 [Gigaspora margarita]|uniref:21567_t:CDS:1 n=1 Tax=Gigaspora margarita TaxID=4874 RepID=A0ABN7UCY4_GIGMA|nr:21567_t:CDS:10 [Gigaspora margarita]